MKLEIPFYKQENKYDCGPTALKMVLDFLSGNDYSRFELQELVDSDKSGVTWTIGLAVASAKLGFKTDFYSKQLGFNPNNYDLDFYKKLADESSSTKKKLEKLKSEAVKLGVNMSEKTFSIDEILKKISSDCVPIILLDWAKIKGSNEFTGHFVPIVGYDKDNVYVHNQGMINPTAFLSIRREVFESARIANGTDEDIIFIYRN